MIKLISKTGLYFSLMTLCILTDMSCNKKDSGGTSPKTSTLGYILANGSSTTIFNSAVVKAGLDTLFNSSSIFTLLIPTDQACIQSGFTPAVVNGFTYDEARNWVLYQTYAGTALTFESFIGKSELKLIMANGDSIFVSGDSNRTYVNGYQFINSEVSASNGTMLALQSVLVRPTHNLSQLISNDTSLTFFYQAVQIATPAPDTLNNLLTGAGPYTLLAPVNDAFRLLGYNSPSDLNSANPDSLRTMILTSMIPLRLFSYDMTDSLALQTVNDSTLIINLSGIQTRVRLSGGSRAANFVSYNSMAINGVLFKIDSVLVH